MITARRVTTGTFFVAVFIGIVGCGSKDVPVQPSQQKKEPLVAIAPVQISSISSAIDLTGEAVAVNFVKISSTVEGPVGYCPWREGDRIEKAGQKLIEIDRELYRSEVNAAEATLGVARAKLEDLKAGTRPEEIAKAKETVRQLEESAAFAKSDLDRISKMVESGSLPGESLEKAQVEYISQQTKLSAARKHLEMLETGYTRTTIAVQEAMVKEAETKVELARARLAECIIAAPFAGTITRVYVRPGDMAAMKTPLLEMVDLSSMVIRVAVTEAQAGDVREGTPAVVQLDALHGKTFHGKVVRAYPELDRRMRTRTVELVLDEQADLVPGMFARVKLILNSMADALVVPREAVVTTPAGAHIVFVVEEGMAVQRKVNTGIEEGDRVQILSGLCAGEKAIVKGHEKIKDGAAVRVPESGKAPGKDSPPSQSVPSGAPAKGENK